MEGMNLKKFLKKRRGVSQIIGSVFMLAIVAAIGSLLLLQGMEGINNFVAFLDLTGQGETRSVHESILFEHVRLEPLSDTVAIWIRNTGTDTVNFESLTMVKIDTQELIIDSNDFFDPIDKTAQVFVKQMVTVNYTDAEVDLASLGCTKWDCAALLNKEYRISLTTVRGNTFETVVQPFDT